MNVPRHYYQPTPQQRAELLLAQMNFRRHIAQLRRAREQRQRDAKAAP